MNTIRLMLVDDHDIVRTGLKSFLDTQEGWQVVAEASSGQEAVTARALAPGGWAHTWWSGGGLFSVG